MISNKRAYEFDSPEVLMKRRRMGESGFGGKRGAPNGAAFAFTDVSNLDMRANKQLGMDGARMTKRKRGPDEGAEMMMNEQSNEIARLRQELENVKREAFEKVSQVELVNQNLTNACIEQQKELVKMQQENKLLKRSILTLNTKREEAERQAYMAKQCAQEFKQKMHDLEQAVMFSFGTVNGQSCRRDGFGGSHNQDGGPVY